MVPYRIAIVAIFALQGPAFALPDTDLPQRTQARNSALAVKLAQAKKAPARDMEALYRQCRAAVVAAYGRPSGLKDSNQDSLNAEMRMQEATSLDSKIDYCVQNGGRP